MPLADVGAEFLFQVISERAERAALVLTTNLPFSEWTTVFPNRQGSTIRPHLIQVAAPDQFAAGLADLLLALEAQ
ncbi:MAG: ATP-binding protein [Bryobacterales bacterium]|nr:ATP-binding protein [Bryobacterales bacterium]